MDRNSWHKQNERSDMVKNKAKLESKEITL